MTIPTRRCSACKKGAHQDCALRDCFCNCAGMKVDTARVDPNESRTPTARCRHCDRPIGRHTWDTSPYHDGIRTDWVDWHAQTINVCPVVHSSHEPKFCEHCNGYGSSLKEDADRCTACGGTGLTPVGSEVVNG